MFFILKYQIRKKFTEALGCCLVGNLIFDLSDNM